MEESGWVQDRSINIWFSCIYLYRVECRELLSCRLKTLLVIHNTREKTARKFGTPERAFQVMIENSSAFDQEITRKSHHQLVMLVEGSKPLDG